MDSVTGERMENYELENKNLSYASRQHRHHGSLAEQELNRKTGSEDYHHIWKFVKWSHLIFGKVSYEEMFLSLAAMDITMDITRVKFANNKGLAQAFIPAKIYYWHVYLLFYFVKLYSNN